MMLLPQQVQAILYHLLMGWFYGCTFSFLCSFTSYFKGKLTITVLELLFHMAFTCFAYWGLFSINGGVTNLYLVLIFMSGVFIYYRWYSALFFHLYTRFFLLFRPIYKKIILVKLKILGIIKVSHTTLARRRKRGKHKDGGKEKEETKKPVEKIL